MAEAEALELVSDMELREYRSGGPIEPATPLQRQVRDVLGLRWRVIEKEKQIASRLSAE